RSYMWFDLAALGGDTDAATARDDIARSLDADALRLAQGLVEAWRIGTIDIAANYAPIGTWAANFDPGQSITDPQIVMQVQQVLAQLGYEVGEADGVIGPRTGIAIRAFEAAAGMSETGMINPRLLAVLGSQPV
ncbi:MAG: peptidoglycan-binding domain-containing protein, partial [Cucumibacter sp.]